MFMIMMTWHGYDQLPTSEKEKHVKGLRVPATCLTIIGRVTVTVQLHFSRSRLDERTRCTTTQLAISGLPPI